MTIVAKLIEQTQLNPEKIVIQDKDRAVTSAKFITDIHNVASSLKGKNVLSETNVIIYASNSYAFICTYFAVHLLSARSVVVDPKSETNFLQFIVNKVRPSYIVSSPEELFNSQSNIHKVKNKAENSLIADILFTSGTTGEPKGVALSHQQILDSTLHILSNVGNNETDIELLLMPLSHSFGLGRMRSALYAGTVLVIGYPLNRMKQVFKAIEQHKVTGFGIVPAAWEFILKMSRDKIVEYSSQIQYIELGSAYFSPENKQTMRSWFPETNLVMHYGLTEVSRAIFSRFHHDPHESLGIIDIGTDVRILAPDSSIQGHGIEGEIALRSNWMLSEYLDNPNLTKASFSDGFFKTGDLGLINGKHLYLKGRLKEVINVGGKKVNPQDVESALKKMKFISDCACVAYPDPDMGEVVKAFVVFTEQNMCSEQEIKKYLHDKLPSHMRPQYYENIDSIPKTANGKIQRLKLKSS
ncbi:MAG: rfbL protein [Gammaproteobacteria bacterium]|nr:MAG: rfbL protein [Gammaproteobacteria bacterium]